MRHPSNIHSSLSGLAAEFGLNLETLLPNDFIAALERSEGDLEQAFSWYNLLQNPNVQVIDAANSASTGLGEGEEEGDLVYLASEYNETMMVDLSAISSYLAHRTLDITKGIPGVPHQGFDSLYTEWHEKIREI